MPSDFQNITLGLHIMNILVTERVLPTQLENKTKDQPSEKWQTTQKQVH